MRPIFWILVLTASILLNMACSVNVANNGGGCETDCKAMALAGSVMYADSTPATGAKIYVFSALENIAAPLSAWQNRAPDAYADSQGAYAVDSLDSGDYFIEAFSQRDSVLHSSVQAVALAGAAKSPVAVPVMIMRPVGFIAAQLNGFDILGGVTVTISLIYHGFTITQTRADSLGRFWLNQVPAGAYDLEFAVSNSHYVIPRTSLDVVAGDTVDIMVTGLVSIEVLRANPGYIRDSAAVRALLDSNGIKMPVDSVVSIMYVPGTGDYRIVDLRLANAGVWRLTADICTLSYLRSMDLHGNLLITLPSFIRTLGELSTINLNGNQLAALPDGMADLRRLSSLRLANNHLTAFPVWIGGLADLMELSLSGNPITTLPAQIGGLTRLAQLYLDNCTIDSLPPEISGLRALSALTLQNNRLQRLPDAFTRLASLTKCDLQNNMLAALPDSMDALRNLEMLRLDGNNLGQFAAALTRLPALKYLLMAGNGLRYLPEAVGAMKSLIILDLDSNYIAALPDSIVHLTDLQKLSIDANRICAPSAAIRAWLTANAPGWDRTQECGIATEDYFIFVAPHAGDTFSVGQRMYVDWKPNPTAAETPVGVAIDLSLDGGRTWLTITPSLVQRDDPAWGHYPYVVPESLATATAKYSCVTNHATLRLRDYEEKLEPILQKEEFVILPNLGNALRVNTPNGGEAYAVGDSLTVTWTTRNTDILFVSCSLSVDSGATWLPLGSDQQISVNDPWWENLRVRIPDSIVGPAAGTPISLRSRACRIKISDIVSCTFGPVCQFDISDGVFIIQ
jgi:hypothetical protein